jgi:hypothetical protein
LTRCEMMRNFSSLLLNYSEGAGTRSEISDLRFQI